ncbi:MAG TPA: HAD-IA family hydrolase [Vicinamibacterales bacterium]|nr:HAD-IA family hydrolase [Vicinamibacterales bacterium]
MLHIAFDLDGTLVDSVHDLAASASELATSLGGRPLHEDEVAMMVGDGAGLLVRRALSAAGLNPDTAGALPRFLEIYDRRLLDTTVAYEGVADMLSLASRRARLSVISNKPLAPSQRILRALGLAGYFAIVLGGDGAHGRKPDPAGLRAAAAAADHVMLVGDSPTDFETAEAAGAAFVWAGYGFGARRFSVPPATPYVLERPSDFAAVLDRFAAITSGV